MRTNSKQCGRCKEVLDLEAFSPSQRAKASSWCRACRRAMDRESYSNPARKAQLCSSKEALLEQFRSFVQAHLDANPCVDCGERDLRVLQFDHVRGKKLTEVSKLRGCSLKRVQAEVAKCVVRCGNCHRRKTIRERGHWLLQYDPQAKEKVP